MLRVDAREPAPIQVIADWVREGEPQQLSRALPLTVGTGAAERLQLRVDGEIAAAEDGWVPLELRASTSLTHSLVVESSMRKVQDCQVKGSA